MVRLGLFIKEETRCSRKFSLENLYFETFFVQLHYLPKQESAEHFLIDASHFPYSFS